MADIHESGSLTWVVFALMTVVAWGLYGVLLHTGQVGMADPVNGRYKAFLFVGLAYSSRPFWRRPVSSCCAVPHGPSPSPVCRGRSWRA